MCANHARIFENVSANSLTGVKQNFWLHATCACTEQYSTYQIRSESWWLGLRDSCLGKCVGLGFGWEKAKYLRSTTKSENFQWLKLFLHYNLLGVSDI